ncbi:MAG TPA: DUF982 domain-containing protein [Mesorhizobium sp.]|nr:DUF982 domain-containing protein [Mesorhizobium sp.]
MSDLEFARPVHVRRPGRDVEVETIGEALALLKQWPAPDRDAVFGAALESCEAVTEGEVTLAEAREALAEFAGISNLQVLRQTRGAAREAGVSPGFSH